MHLSALTHTISELAFQRIEAQSRDALQLSRQIGMPNIASKGTLSPRRVQIPTALFQVAPSAPSSSALSVSSSITNVGAGKGKKLIEEVQVAETSKAKETKKGKGILKPAPAAAPGKTRAQDTSAGPTTPRWNWTKKGTHIKITITVPLLVGLSFITQRS